MGVGGRFTGKQNERLLPYQRNSYNKNNNTGETV